MNCCGLRAAARGANSAALKVGIEFPIAFAMAKKKRTPERRYTWRDPKTGRTMGIVIPDPVVKPKAVSVAKIRAAFKAVRASREADRSRSKRSA